MSYENVKCPDCGGPMTSRVNRAKGSRFWGCNDYPKCRGTRNTDGDAPRGRRDDIVDQPTFDNDEGLPSDRQRRNDRGRW